MKGWEVIFGIIGIILLVAVGIILLSLFDYISIDQITNFEECIEAGYPAMESYPRQCRTPDGRSFTESIAIE